MAIRRPPTVFSETISSADLGTGAALGNLADDSITMAKLGTMMSVGETAPTGPFIGQQWFRLSTGVTYQFTNDGTSSFWLDVSSGGIGTSASKSVDFVGDVDPHKATNGSGLAVGSVYYNKTKNKHFICTNATAGSNVWVGKYDAWGGTVTEYSSGGTNYRVHTFLTGGRFIADTALSVDYLIIGGGGGGGIGDGGNYAGGGGGGGAFRTAAALAVTAQAYTIQVGDGGTGSTAIANKGVNGASSIFTPAAGETVITATGGGGGGSKSNAVGAATTGGSGGGAGTPSSAGGAAGTYGTKGGDIGAYDNAGAGGGGASVAGANIVAHNVGSAGGAGEDQVMGLSAADSYTLLTNASAGHVVSGARYFSGGGGGSTNTADVAGGAGGGGAGGRYVNGTTGITGGTGTDNYGGGGGAGILVSSAGAGGAGGSGIVIIRYVLT